MEAMKKEDSKNTKSFMDYYASPTPAKWRKIGDSILIGTSGFSALMMGAPIDDSHKIWIVFTLNGLGVIGKILTNFFTE